MSDHWYIVQLASTRADEREADARERVARFDKAQAAQRDREEAAKLDASQRARERFVAAYRALRMARPRSPHPRLAAKAAGWVEREPVDARALNRRYLATQRYLATHRNKASVEALLVWWRTQRAMAPYSRRLP